MEHSTSLLIYYSGSIFSFTSFKFLCNIIKFYMVMNFSDEMNARSSGKASDYESVVDYEGDNGGEEGSLSSKEIDGKIAALLVCLMVRIHC